MSAWPSALASKLNDLYPQQSSRACSSTLSSPAADPLTVALSIIQSWTLKILDKATELIGPTPQPPSFNDKVIEAFTTYSTASVTTVAALLLSAIFLVYRYLMSDRNSFGWAGGRGSPFLGNWADPTRNISNHFEYIDQDDDLYTSHRPSTVQRDFDAIDDNDPNAPDRVHVRYLNHQLHVDFPPYAISEEKVSVRDLRRKVAEKLNVDPGRVRVLYKSKELKHDRYSLRKYRMKQNSEISAVITERANNYDGQGRDSPSESGSDSASGTGQTNPRRRPRSHSSVRYRSDEQVPQLRTNGNGFLSPNGHISTPVERRHRESLRPLDQPPHRDSLRPPSRGPESRNSTRSDERSDRRTREPSRTRGPSPGPAPASVMTPADPNTPLGKIQTIASTFHTVWIPKCNQFIANPPSDTETRKKEHLKLSESVMSHIVDKADAVDAEGRDDVRTQRKALVQEAQALMKKLDNAAK